MPAPFATRPARDILAGLVEAWDDADTLARGTLAARFDEAREAVRVAAGMTSPPPEGAEHTMSVVNGKDDHGNEIVRLQIHGHTFHLQRDEAEVIGRALLSKGAKS